MTKEVYSKKPTTYNEQVSLLIKRGLIIPDESRALRYLNQINYYRLSVYFMPYQEIKDHFNKDVHFDQILDTYKFDRELRVLVFDCIERIEIALRSQIIHVLACKYNNSHWQDNPEIFKSPYKHDKKKINPYRNLQCIITNNCQPNKKEVYIKHYMDKYESPKNPPSWMCIEQLTFGEIVKLYFGLKDNKDKQDIADFFALHHSVFSSWIHSIAYIRNITAHHARLWNRELAIKPEILKKPRKNWVSNSFNNNQRIFYFLCTIKYMLHGANPNNHFTIKLDKLFQKYPKIPIRYMGMPTELNGTLINWKDEPLWSYDENSFGLISL